MRSFGTVDSTSVQADRHGPSMTTRSPDARTRANKSRNGATSPPGLARMRTSADAGDASRRNESRMARANVDGMVGNSTGSSFRGVRLLAGEPKSRHGAISLDSGFAPSGAPRNDEEHLITAIVGWSYEFRRSPRSVGKPIPAASNPPST